MQPSASTEATSGETVACWLMDGSPHGLKDGQAAEGDWTHGCIAVRDEEMDEIWGLVGDGTPIVIEA